METEQEGPPPAPPPSSSQAVKERRATINQELEELVGMHYPHLNYDQVASPDFNLDLLDEDHLPDGVRRKTEDKRRQVGPSILQSSAVSCSHQPISRI